ncbi:MAG: NOB1 family endonuclease [Halobacteriales archaeon]|nr:NOB1 family endonuclease [Halobacteriales archaeon]
MHVLDASAFIHDYHTSEPTATIPAVRDELSDESRYRFDAMEGSGMHIQLPEEATVERVRRAAEGTGDAGVLSTTDVRLIAAALELGATLVTDDYAVQNVASRLDVAVEVIAREGISERREWHHQCSGCGRTYDEAHDRCPVCGSDLSRKRPR